MCRWIPQVQNYFFFNTYHGDTKTLCTLLTLTLSQVYSGVFLILLFFLYLFALITEEDFLISPCYSLELCIQMNISFVFSSAFSFSSFLSYLLGLLRQPFFLFAFLFLGNGFDHRLLYSVMHLSIVLQALCLSDLIP